MQNKQFYGFIVTMIFLVGLGMYWNSQAREITDSSKTLKQIALLTPKGKVIHSKVQLLFTQEQVVQNMGKPIATFDHQWVYDNLLLGFDYKINCLFSIASNHSSVTQLTLSDVKKEFTSNPDYQLLGEENTQDNRYVLIYKHLNRTRVQFTFPLPSKKQANPHVTSYAVISGETY